MRMGSIFRLTLLSLIFLFISPLFCYADQKLELKFWHVMTGAKEKALNELVGRFNSANPDIKIVPVQVTSKDQCMGNDYHALYKAMLEGISLGNPPDIAQVYENWTVQLIGIGAIVPVEDYKGKIFSQSLIDDIIPVFKESNTFDGKLWTLPFNKSVYVLYYNKDLFNKVGLKPPSTWSEFKSTAKKLTSRDGANISVIGFAFKPSVDIFGHYLYADGGAFIEGNKSIFNSDAGLDALNYFIDMINTDGSAIATFEDYEEFSKGKSAMYIETSSKLSSFKKSIGFNLGVAPLPAGKEKKYQFAGTNLAVFSHLNAKKREAAMRFLRFLVEKDSSIYWAEKTGYLPVTESAINSDKYKNMVKSEPVYAAGVEAIRYAVSQPKCAAWEMIRGIIDDMMYDALSGKEPPKAALEKAKGAADSMISNIAGKK